ncbi:hypothetical protein [Flavisolibacter nicotianae]|uniref:hypothetical protein n=1 Tax=Flavisolibacter nicotianae TaxID=2364882 RepID=UPI0013C44088|nr:hypothetical protein [Flavisolibacter nicotianae]
MKSSRDQSNMQNKQMAGHRPVPQNRDDLDSRKNEEQETKGDDITHNQKDVKHDRKKVKND